MEKSIKKITNSDLDTLIINNKNTFNSLDISLPYAYFNKLITMTLKDVIYFINKKYTTIDSLAEHALFELESGYYSEEESLILKIAIIDAKDKSNDFILNKLILEITEYNNDKVTHDRKLKLLYVVLNFVYENKSMYEDLLRVFEIIYSDFDYPIEMKKFIRYQPLNEIDNNNENPLDIIMNNFTDFLQENKQKFSK